MLRGVGRGRVRGRRSAANGRGELCGRAEDMLSAQDEETDLTGAIKETHEPLAKRLWPCR